MRKFYLTINYGWSYRDDIIEIRVDDTELSQTQLDKEIYAEFYRLWDIDTDAGALTNMLRAVRNIAEKYGGTFELLPVINSFSYSENEFFHDYELEEPVC